MYATKEFKQDSGMTRLKFQTDCLNSDEKQIIGAGGAGS
jgi:hypothetical protein